MQLRSTIVGLSMLAVWMPALGAEQPDTRAFPNLTVIYVVPGVRDDGGAFNAGVATSFHCTNTDTQLRQLRFTLRGPIGNLVANATYNVPPQFAFTASTHFTNLYREDVQLAAGFIVDEGTTYISATSPSIFCTAMTVDAASTSPNGIALHMIRRNPASGSEE